MNLFDIENTYLRRAALVTAGPIILVVAVGHHLGKLFVEVVCDFCEEFADCWRAR